MLPLAWTHLQISFQARLVAYWLPASLREFLRIRWVGPVQIDLAQRDIHVPLIGFVSDSVLLSSNHTVEHPDLIFLTIFRTQDV